MSRKSCQETKKLIQNEKKLRNMDHAFRLLLFIEALAVVKKHFSEEPNGGRRTNQRDRSARQAITDVIDELQQASQLDINAILHQIL